MIKTILLSFVIILFNGCTIKKINTEHYHDNGLNGIKKKHIGGSIL